MRLFARAALFMKRMRRRERDYGYVNLLDRFCTLHRLRLDAITRAERTGSDEILNSDELRTLKQDTVRCLDELLARSPSLFFRKVRRELLAELDEKKKP